MAVAFVLINAELGTENELAEQIQQIEHVSRANVLYGAYDIAVKIEASNSESVKRVISEKIRQLKNVRSTLTMTVIEQQEI